MALYTVVIDPRTGRPRKLRGTDPVTLQPPKRVARLRPAEQPAALDNVPDACPGGLSHHTLGFLGGLFK